MNNQESEKSYFDNLSGQWDQDSIRSNIALNVARSIHKQFEHLQKSVMLDFGCGTGLLSFYFYPQLKRLDGVDTSMGMVDEFNRKAQKENWIHATAKIIDPDNGELPENEYDVVISSMVFHHLKEPSEVLKMIFSSLKKGGKIAIADLDEEDGSFHPLGIEGVFHHGFSRDVMKSWFENAGFQNVQSRTALQLEKEGKKYSIFVCFGERP